jgi:hypothetical protein
MTIKNKRVVTVLNENGRGAVHLGEYYNKGTTVKNIQTTFLDASGNVVKKIKRKEFSDYCATDGGTVFRIVGFCFTIIPLSITHLRPFTKAKSKLLQLLLFRNGNHCELML